MSARTALGRLLAGTGYSYTFVGPQSVRIVRARAHRAARSCPAKSALVARGAHSSGNRPRSRSL
jgi:hypothetical protein